MCVWYGVAMWRGREASLVRVWGVTVEHCFWGVVRLSLHIDMTVRACVWVCVWHLVAACVQRMCVWIMWCVCSRKQRGKGCDGGRGKRVCACMWCLCICCVEVVSKSLEILCTKVRVGDVVYSHKILVVGMGMSLSTYGDSGSMATQCTLPM